MKVDVFDYALPPERIAQEPAPEREAARLMVLPASGGAPTHTTIASLPALLPDGALVVLNDTRVVPARLLGVKADSGGKVEIFLVHEVGAREIDGAVHQVWRALGRASKGLRAGTSA